MQSSIALKVREIIAGHFHIDPKQITDEARFRDDLGADWLDRLEVIVAIEVAGFEMSHVVADRIDTVGDLMRAIEDPHRDLSEGRESVDEVRMDRKNTGANFQIVMDGKSLSYRDAVETALEAGIFLKERHPQSEIVVRDLTSGAQTVIGWKSGKAFSGELTSPIPAASRPN
jgi:acyl carrier protein